VSRIRGWRCSGGGEGVKKPHSLRNVTFEVMGVSGNNYSGISLRV
jgi:hypothetical protein